VIPEQPARRFGAAFSAARDRVQPPLVVALGCLAALLVSNVADAPGKTPRRHPRELPAITALGGHGDRVNSAPNRELAAAIAQHLLGTLVLPAEATESSTDPSVSGLLGHRESAPATPQLTGAHRFWRIPGAPAAMLNWLKAHPPAGSEISGSGSSGRASPELKAYLEKHRPAPAPIEDLPGYTTLTWWVEYSFPEVPGRISSVALQADVAEAAGGGTALRADSEVVWAIPRPASEHIPARIRLVEAVVNESARHVHIARAFRSPGVIRGIIATVERLERQGAGACVPPAFEGEEVELRFRRSKSSAPVARVRANENPCRPAEVWVRGQRQPDLARAYEIVEAVRSSMRR
jgi:hypothetical protein